MVQKRKSRIFTPLETHRLKQREQYKTMLSSLETLTSVLPDIPTDSRMKTKQMILTQCSRYIQYLQVLIWKYSNELRKPESLSLPFLMFDGQNLTDHVIEMLGNYKPITQEGLQVVQQSKSSKLKKRRKNRAHVDRYHTSLPDDNKNCFIPDALIKSEKKAGKISSLKNIKKEESPQINLVNTKKNSQKEFIVSDKSKSTGLYLNKISQFSKVKKEKNDCFVKLEIPSPKLTKSTSSESPKTPALVKKIFHMKEEPRNLLRNACENNCRNNKVDFYGSPVAKKKSDGFLTSPSDSSQEYCDWNNVALKSPIPWMPRPIFRDEGSPSLFKHSLLRTASPSSLRWNHAAHKLHLLKASPKSPEPCTSEKKSIKVKSEELNN